MATFTIQNVVTDVREAVQDTSTVNPRYSDAQIVRAVNQVIKRIAIMRPDLFAKVANFTCAAGSLQTAPTDSYRIVDLFKASSGHAINEISRETLDHSLPMWQSLTTGDAQNWARHIRNPSVFFIYPPSPANQVLLLEYCVTPSTYNLGDTVQLLNDVYFPCVLDGTVWVLESIDNEHVSSGRAKMASDNFAQLLNISVQAKQVTDTEESGQPPGTVR